MISRALRNKIRVSDLKSYQIAHRAGIHPSTLSKIVCGIEKVEPGDPRVKAIANILGLPEEACFDEDTLY